MKKNLQSIFLLLAALFLPSAAHAADGLPGLGDVNSDGSVDVNDVTDLIGYVLGDASDAFNAENADTNADGFIDIVDVTSLIDYVLQGAWPGEPTQPTTQTFTVNGVSFTMVAVEGGSFSMETTSESNYDYIINQYDRPAHDVTLSSYSIGQTEVTQELWKAVMGCNLSCYNDDLNQPVEEISWYKCQEFILKLNEMTGQHFRLPTEAEWEFAARGGNLSQGYAYSGSNDLDEVAWYWDNIPTQNQYSSEYGTQPVAAKQPNELGLYDMTGNVWEWCQDWLGSTGGGAQTDPVGAASGEYRIVRGGCWNSRDGACHVSDISIAWPLWGNATTGLRLALDVEDSPKLRMSETVVTVVEGESTTVDILNGDGDCQAVSDNEDATCTISGNSLTVTGSKIGREGHATIHVTNTATGAAAVLNVIVTPAVTFTVNGVTFEMVNVEGGTFDLSWLEIPGGHAFDGEMPSPWMRSVANYRIGKTEVTQELWQAVMGSNPSYFKGDLNCPVEQVSWDRCQEFILKLNEMTGMNFRLPTEAEWAFAARGGNLCQARKYAGSNSIDDVAWYSGNSSNRTHPAGTKLPNELGTYDMNGNVWEWCLDLSREEYYTAPTSNRVRRGGCWSSAAENCDVLISAGSAPDDYNNRLGLRLVLDNDEGLRLSENVISVAVGETKAVKILTDRNMLAYVADQELDNFRYYDTNDSIIVTGLQVGTNTIVVSNSSGHEKYLTVIVTPRKPNKTIEVNGVTFSMVPVSGGRFIMGMPPEQEYDWDDVGHEVLVQDYSIGQTEVTQELWQAVMGVNPSQFTGNLNRPVETVSLDDCLAFIAKLNEMTGMNFRLPTEAEWEYAARGGSLSRHYMYSGSNDIDEVAWIWDGITAFTDQVTHPVATKAPNELLIYDMTGNVWEMCDNQQSDTHDYIILRGGSIDLSADKCYWYLWHGGSEPTGPQLPHRDLGLRLAL